MNLKHKLRTNEAGEIERLCSMCQEWLTVDEHFTQTRTRHPKTGEMRTLWQTYCRKCMKNYQRTYKGDEMRIHLDRGQHWPLCNQPQSFHEFLTLTVIESKVTCQRCLARMRKAREER